MVKLNIPKPKIPNFRKLNGLTLLALLSYFHILVLIPLIFGRKSQFVQFHARQGFLLLILWVLFMFSLYIPVLPWLFMLVIVIGILVGIIHVFLGRERPLPFVGKLAIVRNIDPQAIVQN